MTNSLNSPAIKKIQNALGLAQRAGKCVAGDELLDSISKGKISIVILGNDSSDRTQEQISKKCDYYKVTVVKLLSKEEISSAIGKYNRVAVGIADRGFGKMINKYLEETRGEVISE
ncbi:MAG: 50S ribosomal protein L7ae [Erysipelothrix sp.]|nr:50S ribosomal protein L7ae [Erysipelothrix sp.]